MEVDHSAAWQALKASVAHGNRSRGQDELLATMARLEVEYAVPSAQQGFDDRPEMLRETRATTASAA